MKSTKIIATIGPATETEEVLEQLIFAGMNIARFNTKHSTPEWHNERIKRIKKIAAKLNQPIGVLLDLQGPEVRINTPEEKSYQLKRGDFVNFTSDEQAKLDNKIIIPQMVIDALPEKSDILLDDGACEFTVLEKSGTYLIAQAVIDCTVKHRKTMNTPGVVLDMPSLTERDFNYLDGVDSKLIDYVGLSFVRDSKDIEILRAELDKRKMADVGIIAKIENQAALDNIDEIIEDSDAIMIARGDLGIEVHFKKLIYWQKQIIKKCRLHSKPVITATQMLKSMVESSRATRAEVSDVANAIYDRTDAIMLSEETTIGLFPVQAVTVQATIAEYNEEFAENYLEIVGESDLTAAVTHSAIELLEFSDIEINKIVCLTQTGNTARMLSRFRPDVPIEAVTHMTSTYYQLALSYGVNPHLIKIEAEEVLSLESILAMLKAEKIISAGETILFIHGKYMIKTAITNTLSILEIN